MKNNTKRITRAALIAAIYAILTAINPLSMGQIQVRVSEALCVLPLFLPESVAGLFIGCLVSGLLIGENIIDVVVGSLVTLLAAFLTSALRSRHRLLAFAPPVVLNGILTGTLVALLYVKDVTVWGWILTMLSVGAGEAIAVYGLGEIVYRVGKRLFPQNRK